MKRLLPLIALLPALLGSCAAYYSVRSTLGWENRALLVEFAEKAKVEQVAAQTSFNEALASWRELSRDDGTNLEALAEQFRTDAKEASSAAGKVRGRIGALQNLSKSVFSEWEDDIAEILTSLETEPSPPKVVPAARVRLPVPTAEPLALVTNNVPA